MTKLRILVCAAAMLMLVYAPGCKANNDQPGKTASTAPVVVSADGQQAGAPAQMPPQQPAIEGKVLETMDASGYTYVQVETAGGPVWAAMPQTKVEVGQDVALAGGMPMTNFESKSLGRTFDSIIFSGGMISGAPASASTGTGALPPGHESFASAMQGEAGMATPESMGTSGGSKGAAAAAEDIKVDKAEGENGQTVGDIFAMRKDLDGKKVQIRGKVVKFSPMIMGKNWIHLQDGTGDAGSKTHDLVVTTMANAATGDVIVIEGMVAADKDFGSGYRYDVIVEEAEIK